MWSVLMMSKASLSVDREQVYYRRPWDSSCPWDHDHRLHANVLLLAGTLALSVFLCQTFFYREWVYSALMIFKPSLSVNRVQVYLDAHGSHFIRSHRNSLCEGGF